LERSGRHHYLPGPEDLILDVDLEALRRLAEPGDPAIQPYRQIERPGIGLKVVGDRIFGGVGV
jgi:hypothetical protein